MGNTHIIEIDDGRIEIKVTARSREEAIKIMEFMIGCITDNKKVMINMGEWAKLPNWKDTHREIYRKRVMSEIQRVNRKKVKGKHDEKKLLSLHKELYEIERRGRIAAALAAAGYEGEPTPERLRECFLDYVGAGYFRNIDLDDANEMIYTGEITENDMIYNLIKIGG